MEKYNGWTNYETWRVNLEIFDGFDPSEYYSKFDPSDVCGLGESLKSYAEEVIFECAEVPNGLARDYALAFLDAVNWYEIAKHMLSEIELNNIDRILVGANPHLFGEQV
jgi:hypothetical protein